MARNGIGIGPARTGRSPQRRISASPYIRHHDAMLGRDGGPGPRRVHPDKGATRPAGPGRGDADPRGTAPPPGPVPAGRRRLRPAVSEQTSTLGDRIRTQRADTPAKPGEIRARIRDRRPLVLSNAGILHTRAIQSGHRDSIARQRSGGDHDVRARPLGGWHQVRGYASPRWGSWRLRPRAAIHRRVGSHTGRHPTTNVGAERRVPRPGHGHRRTDAPAAVPPMAAGASPSSATANAVGRAVRRARG